VISKSNCQDTTDLEKSVAWLDHSAPTDTTTLSILGVLGGRFDQTMAIVNSLVKIGLIGRWNTYFIDGENLAIPLSTVFILAFLYSMKNSL
jgi:thiamine pyrophosphokinase